MAETPTYALVTQDGPIEVRDYPCLMLAQTWVVGTRSNAISRGFKILADYIFARSRSGDKIAMTAPVVQEPSQPDQWRIGFVMPSTRGAASLPDPQDPRVELVQWPARRLAAIRFSGFAWDDKLQAQKTVLLDWLAKQKQTPTGPPIFAFYDPPWSPPWTKRHEVLIELAGN
ncbi:MAG: heme-binding protein [Rhodothalassiaceae bacterium]